MTDKLKVTVSVSYNTVAETDDPFLVIEIMRLIAEHEANNPKPVEPPADETAEEKLARELAEARADNETYRRLAQERQAKLDALQSDEEVPF